MTTGGIGTTITGGGTVVTGGGGGCTGWIVTGGSCGDTLDGADVVYSFTTTTAGPVTVRANPQRGYNLDLAVVSACTASSCIDSRAWSMRSGMM